MRGLQIKSEGPDAIYHASELAGSRCQKYPKPDGSTEDHNRTLFSTCSQRYYSLVMSAGFDHVVSLSMNYSARKNEDLGEESDPENRHLKVMVFMLTVAVMWN